MTLTTPRYAAPRCATPRCAAPRCAAPRSATKFHVAPLQAYTHRHMRNFLRLLSTSAVLWTEMEKASDLLRSDTAFANALEPGATSPVVLQIGGSDPRELGAVATAARGRFAELNLNAGCPTVETGGADYGASLLRTPQTAAACTEAMAAAFEAPVSVKCRTAAFEGLDDGGGVPEAQ